MQRIFLKMVIYVEAWPGLELCEVPPITHDRGAGGGCGNGAANEDICIPH